MAIEIKRLAPTSTSKSKADAQGVLPLVIAREGEFDGVGMGVLSDGTPYLSQRGLAVLCGVQNAHIGTISSKWNDDDQTARIASVKRILGNSGSVPKAAHYDLLHGGRNYHCYTADVCLAVLEYYAFDAGVNVSEQARANFRRLAGSRLRDLIYSRVGYDPSGRNRFDKWHERLALNYQSAPKGFFHVFNEAHTVIYELIVAGADIDERFVVDISIGQHWSRHWEEHLLGEAYGHRAKYPHRYPESHPQSKSNPQESWCYPLASLGEYREWLGETYLNGGKLRGYLSSKVSKGDIAPSFAELALEALEQKQLR